MDSTEKQYYVDRFLHGVEIYYRKTLENLQEKDQAATRKEVASKVVPSLLLDVDSLTDELRMEIANGNFSSLNAVGLIWMMGYSNTTADFGVDHKMPGELVEEVNMEYGRTFRAGGRWI